MAISMSEVQLIYPKDYNPLFGKRHSAETEVKSTKHEN